MPTVFDSQIPALLDADYTPPAAVESSSLFGLVDEPPAHRWFLVGAPSSGTQLHTDPLATCAWNALVFGKKQWALFPPRTPCADGENGFSPHMQAAERALDGSRSLTAATWFRDFLPRTRSVEWCGPPVLELVQAAGETVFVPEGWRHAVLNLELTVAITHNVAHPSALSRMLRMAAHVAPAFSQRLCRQLRLNGHCLPDESEAVGIQMVGRSRVRDEQSDELVRERQKPRLR
uniref:JmjC domain-containing protein n=1 Tax=Coccolithus braarudii TaxID=221442 RepID=A0A7S0LBS9_9EUKA